MKVLNRYIALEVIKGSLVAELVLLALLNFFTFTDELGDLGHGDYGLKQIAQYLTLSTPRSFYELMPSAALLGSMVTLGALSNNRELVAMQAAGASRFFIIRAVLRGGLILALLSAVVGEYVAPPCESAAQVLKATALKEQIASRTKYGFWVRDGDVYINIRQLSQQNELGDISIYELDDRQQLREASHAARARYADDAWRLEDIRSSRFDRDAVVSESQENLDWSSVLAPDLLKVFVVRAENLSAVDLAKYMTYLQENGQDSRAVELAFWERLVNPFVTLVMLLVALPFVMTFNREVGVGQRIVFGVIIGLGFYLFDRMFGHLGLIYQMNPLLASALPTGVMFLLAVAGITRNR